MPFTGLRSYFPTLSGPFVCQAHKRDGIVVHVRRGGVAAYMLHAYHMLFSDEHRLARLEQSVRAEMAKVDARIGNSAIVLADGVSGAPITSVAALDRLTAGGRTPTLIYKIDTSRPAAAPTALPPIARRIGAPLAVTLTPESRLEKLRSNIVAQLSTALGASATVPDLGAARSQAQRVLRANQDGLRAIGFDNPVHQSNLIAADLAAAVRNVDGRALTAANAPRVFAAALNKSPVWSAIECRMAPACKAKPTTPVYVDEDEADEEEEAPETPAQLMARIGATLGAAPMRLPITYISSAVPTWSGLAAPKPATSATASIGARMAAAAAPAAAAPADDVLARIGFRVHTAADYAVSEVPVITPIGGEACAECQTIGHRYRCGRRCRRHYRRMEEEAAFKKAQSAPTKITADVAGLEFRPLAAESPKLEFRPLGAEAAPIAAETAPVAAKTAPIAAPIEPTITFRPLQAQRVAAPINLNEPRPVRVSASAPAGFRVLLRDTDGKDTPVDDKVVSIQPGPRHIVVQNAAGKQRTATEAPIHFHAGQTHAISVEMGAKGTQWRCATSDIGDAIAAEYGSLLAAHTSGLVLLHTDGTATSAPIGAWADVTNEEHEAAAASGSAYIFDAKRAFVADATNRMHPVLAVAKHPTAPKATVVLLPPISLPASN